MILTSLLAALAPWTNPIPNLSTGGIFVPPINPTLPVLDFNAAAYPARYPASCSLNINDAIFGASTKVSIYKNFLSLYCAEIFVSSFSNSYPATEIISETFAAFWTLDDKSDCVLVSITTGSFAPFSLTHAWIASTLAWLKLLSFAPPSPVTIPILYPFELSVLLSFLLLDEHPTTTSDNVNKIVNRVRNFFIIYLLNLSLLKLQYHI